MTDRTFELSSRDGRVCAAYLHLHAAGRDAYARSEARSAGMVADFDRDGRVIGVELTAPSLVTLDALDALDELLRELGEPPVAAEELVPLRAA